jgi:hypothetical protein
LAAAPFAIEREPCPIFPFPVTVARPAEFDLQRIAPDFGMTDLRPERCSAT